MNKETSIIKRNAKDSMIQIRHIQIICGILKIRNEKFSLIRSHFIMSIVRNSKISTIYGLIILKLSMAS